MSMARCASAVSICTARPIPRTTLTCMEAETTCLLLISQLFPSPFGLSFQVGGIAFFTLCI